MREQPYGSGSLFGRSGSRKYLNAAERRRFLESTQQLPPIQRSFCLTLAWSGGRISEILALTAGAIDLEAGVATLCTLKRRRLGVMRQVPLPGDLLLDLDHVFHLRVRQRNPQLACRPLWRWSRTTAWRCIKKVMAMAGTSGNAAMPKALRHAFGVKAFESQVPPHLVQRWLGHASLRTTSIYGDVMGPEEREIAARMWSEF
jgi:integrase/recombinase XerD